MTTRKEARTIARIIRELGAQMIVATEPWEPLTRTRIIAARWRVDPSADPDADHPICNWPVHSATLTVIYDAPFGPEEHNWRARPAKLLRHALQAGGVALADTAFIAMWPRRFTVDNEPPPRGIPRAPTDTELRARKPAIRAAIVAANARYVLLMGSAAQRYWRPDLQLGNLSGYVGIDGAHIVMAVEHPNAVLRESIDPVIWRWRIAKFAGIVDEDIGLSAIETACVVRQCRAEATAYDPYGVGYCELHVDNGFNSGYNLKYGRGVKVAQTERLFD